MKKTFFFSNRLDDSNGSGKDPSNSAMEQNETATPNLAKSGNSIAELLARVVNVVLSFVANLLSHQTRKEGVRRGQVSRHLRELSQTTAVGTLYGLLFAGLLLAPIYPVYSAVDDDVWPCLSLEYVEVRGSNKTHYGYICSKNWDRFITCLKNARNTRNRSLRDARTV